jgi:hypothetical protein
VKHLVPTFHGDTAYVETTVLDKYESKGKPDRGVVYAEIRATNQRGTKVLTFRRKVLLYKRGAGPSTPEGFGGLRFRGWLRIIGSSRSFDITGESAHV